MMPERIWATKTHVDWFWSDVADEYDDATEYVRAPQWISVKDRLPEDGDLVLVHGGTARMYCGDWFSEKSGTQIQWTVTHWMPLPEPPKEEENA